MTTKEALELAIITLKREEHNEKNSEAIKRLQQLQRRDIVAKWSKESIIEALEKWKDQHGRPPTVTNLIEPDMPGANIIQKHFGMRASALLHKLYFSNDNTVPRKNQYGYQSPEDWLSCFREQFLKHCHEEGFSSNTYNMHKDKGTPLWMTIARHCGTTQWSKLMELAGVKYPGQKEQKKVHISAVKSPWLERLEAAITKREALDKHLIDCIERNSKHRREK